MPTQTTRYHDILTRSIDLLDEGAFYNDDAWPEELEREFAHLRLQFGE